MKAYFIHWSYGASADDQLYYSGTDDGKLFHHKENAINHAETILKKCKIARDRFCELENKYYEGVHLTQEETEELSELGAIYDSPISYTIAERNIVFED